VPPLSAGDGEGISCSNVCLVEPPDAAVRWRGFYLV
jgi:hypothetical protein